jgi:hypothetical protein
MEALMLMALVQSGIRRLPYSLCPVEKIHCRTRGHKWNFLKVREGKYKGEHGVVQVGSRGRLREHAFLSQILLKPTITYGKGGSR